jgi:hypothetical protein
MPGDVVCDRVLLARTGRIGWRLRRRAVSEIASFRGARDEREHRGRMRVDVRAATVVWGTSAERGGGCV